MANLRRIINFAARIMKLLVFAHTPPPHHGQSYMVQLMLAGLGGDRRKRIVSGSPPAENASVEIPRNATESLVECYHVNARLSQNLEDIGDFRIGKFVLLLGYCLQAIWCRFRYGVTNFYYIPAPGKPSALYRDWLVMLICRPFFKRVILHWHAAGLAKWLETVMQIRSRSLTYRLLRQVDMSIVLSKYNQADAEKIFSRQIRVVSNGIPDPCPAFAQEVLPRRRARHEARLKLNQGNNLDPGSVDQTWGDPREVKVLYLAHCTHEKGVFDSIAGIRLANDRLLQSQSPFKLRLLVAGTFVTTGEKQKFDRLIQDPAVARFVDYHGFVSGTQKHQLLREADLFCFPTWYQNENQPVNLIEAMAFGLPILTTRWRSIPELFPASYPALVEVRSPEQIAMTLIAMITGEPGEGFREIFLREFTLQRHLSSLTQALQDAERAGDYSAAGVPLPSPQ